MPWDENGLDGISNDPKQLCKVFHSVKQQFVFFWVCPAGGWWRKLQHLLHHRVTRKALLSLSESSLCCIPWAKISIRSMTVAIIAFSPEPQRPGYDFCVWILYFSEKKLSDSTHGSPVWLPGASWIQETGFCTAFW